MNPTRSHALRWGALSQYGLQAIRFATSIVLARYLPPEDFGLLGMVVVFSSFIQVCSDLGFGSILIKSDSKDLVTLSSTLNTASLGLGILGAVVLLMVSPLVGLVYSQPEAIPIACAVALTLPLSSLAIIPRAHFVRQLSFQKLGLIDLTTYTLSGICAISFAAHGGGVWSLVLGDFCRAIAQYGFLQYYSPMRVGFAVSRGLLHDQMQFGKSVATVNVLSFLTRNVDSFIVGVVFGPTALGHYSFAYRIMLLPKDLFAAVAGQVLLPSLSQALGDEEKMKEIVASAISGVAFLAFPLMAGISLVVGDIVELFLGPEWLPAVGLIQLLTVAGAVQSFWPIGNKVLLLSSDAKRLLRWGTVCTCTSIGAFAVGATYSVGAMAGLYAIVSVWNSALLIKMMAQERNVFSPWFVVSCLRVEFAMTFLMAIVAFSAQWLLDDFPIIARISITAAVGLLTYGVLAILIRPKGFLEFAHVAGVSRLFQVKNSERTYVNTHNAIN